jgi:hypothetical protein
MRRRGIVLVLRGIVARDQLAPRSRLANSPSLSVAA